jgi:hypothetical protein
MDELINRIRGEKEGIGKYCNKLNRLFFLLKLLPNFSLSLSLLFLLPYVTLTCCRHHRPDTNHRHTPPPVTPTSATALSEFEVTSTGMRARVSACRRVAVVRDDRETMRIQHGSEACIPGCVVFIYKVLRLTHV